MNINTCKLLFLDVDGVLNNTHTRTITHDGWCFVDDYLVALLASFVKQTDVKIVLSSTWREGWNRDNEEKNEPYFNQLRDKLKEYGMEIYDALPLPLTNRRGEAIKKYFDTYSGPLIESFVIFDDWYDMDQYSNRLVWINPHFGLREIDIEEALNLLKK